MRVTVIVGGLWQPLNKRLAAVAAQDLDYVVVIAIVLRRGWGGA
jgi:hypothetical protein